MIDESKGLLIFIKYAMIIVMTSITTSFLIVYNFIDAKTILNNGFIMMGALILVLFLMVLAIIMEIVAKSIIEWRKKRKHEV